jgi:hypothetical protein
LPEGGLAGTAQADEGDARAARSIAAAGAEQLADRHSNAAQRRLVAVLEQFADQ